MRVLIADKLTHGALHAIEVLGHEVEFAPALKPDSLVDALETAQPHVLVVRSTKVSAPALEASGSLGLVIRAGAGVNTIDLKTASKRGIFVANCPGKNAVAVAELTLGILIALDRRIAEASQLMHEGRWEKSTFSKAEGLFGRRLGLVGFGATAREMASRAISMGMQVQAWTPRLEASMARPYGVDVAESLDALLSTSDAVSVHCPMNPSTRGLIGARELSLIPAGGIFIHTARGGIVDDAALAAHARSGHLRVGLDVFDGEPGSSSDTFDNEIRNVAAAVLTPHIGASTAQALESTGAEVTRIIQDFATLGVVHNVVNIADASQGRHRLIVRHEDRVGVLAGVLDALRRAQLNVKEMQNVIFDGAPGDVVAASATIIIEQLPSPDLLQELRSLDAILGVDMRSSTS